MTAASEPAAAAAPGEWGREAACAAAGLDPLVAGVFTSDSWTPWDVAAIAVCRRCPVRTACAAYAESTQPGSGIWGGWRRLEHRPVRRHGTLSVTTVTATIGVGRRTATRSVTTPMGR